MQHKLSAIAGVVSLSLLLSACDSDDDEDVPLLPNATSSGVVSGFGSVYVNGLRYVTENSSIIENGTESSEEALKVGMKVTIKANQSASNDPTAIEVKYIADAIGEIKDIDLAASSLTILGQTYLITDASKFEGVAFNELRENVPVELSAFENANGSFTVTYLTTRDDISEQQLIGTVSKLKKLEKTFFIGDLAVNYTNADVQGGLYDGSTVSIKSDIGLVGSEFIADEVNVQGLVLVIGGTLTVAGFVENTYDINEGKVIEIDGRNFLLTDESEFGQGDEDDLRVGSQVNLIATVIDSDEELPYYPITDIRVELGNDISLEGIVEATSDQSFTMFGKVFTVDGYTQYEDDSEQALRNFNFTDIAIGDRLEVDAFGVDGALISRNIEREETGAIEQDTHEIEGVVDDINIDLVSFSVKGIQILTNEQTDFEDAFVNSVNQADFLSALVLNDEVEVTFNGDDWVAVDVEVDGDAKDNDVEFLGRIDSVLSDNTYVVNGHQVMTSEQTEFENGTSSNMVQGTLIDIEGVIGLQGLLFAQEIEFIEANQD